MGLSNYRKVQEKGLLEQNLYLFVYNNSINSIDILGLETWRCSRKLGGSDQSAVSQYAKVRHDFIKVEDDYYSFGPRGSRFGSKGRVSKNTENDDGGKCHTMICDDEIFDEIITEVAESYEPNYAVDTNEGTPQGFYKGLFGYKNCKSWTTTVINKAKKRYFKYYKESKECPKCFNRR